MGNGEGTQGRRRRAGRAWHGLRFSENVVALFSDAHSCGLYSVRIVINTKLSIPSRSYYSLEYYCILFAYRDGFRRQEGLNIHAVRVSWDRYAPHSPPLAAGAPFPGAESIFS